MPDSQILSAGTETVPESYKVPANQEIILKSVSATIDGTSASGNFVPVLEIDNGSAAGPWQFALQETVTAGGSVTVTWGPFPVSAAQTATAGVSGDYQVDPINVAAGTAAFVPWLFITGTQVLDLTDPTTPTVTVPGVYSVSASIGTLNNATSANFFQVDLQWSWPSAVNSHMTATAYSATLTDSISANVGYAVAMQAGDSFRIRIWNHDSGTRKFASDNVPITRQA